MSELLIVHLLIAFSMIISVVFFKLRPPKKINYFYGYRTKLSMKNEDTWQEGNAYSTQLLMWVTIALVIVQAITYFILPAQASLIVSIIFLTFGTIAVIPLTQKHLKSIFDENGKRR